MSDRAWVPQSCTLPTEERPLRVAEWDALFSERLTSLFRPQPLHLRLDLAGGEEVEEQVRDLVEREKGCCSFFSFTTRPAQALPCASLGKATPPPRSPPVILSWPPQRHGVRFHAGHHAGAG